VAAAALRALTERSRSARALPSGERPGGRLLELTIERAAGAALASEHARVRLAAWTALATGGPSLARSEDLVTRWSRLEDDWQRSAALGVALAQGPSLWTTIAWRIAEPGVESLARELAPRALAGGDPAQARAVLDLAASRRPLSAGLRRELARALAERAGELGLAAEGLVARALEELLASADQELALCALELTDAWDRRDRLAPEVAALAERLGSVLADEGARADDRARALEALVARPASRAAALGHVPALLQPWQPAEVQERAVDALGALEGGDAAGALAAAIPAATSALRERILDRIAARPASVAVLLAEIEGGALDARLLGTRGIHRLRTYPDAELAARAARLVPAAASSAEIAALVERLLPEVESSGAPGDALRGQAVFAAQCAQCHRAGNEGGRVGPELTGIGARGAAELLPIILDPNRAVEPAYTEWIAHTTSNEVVAGVLARETPGAILLRWSAGEREIPRADLASLVDTGRSPMPAGFESLGAEALRDLLAFLAGGREGYRVIPLAEHARANSLVGMYDARRDRNPFVPIRFGIVDVEGVPFELLDPARTPAGGNVIVLKGGAVADWESKLLRPRSVEIGVGGAAGLALERVHVLGGIAGWGWPWTKEPLPVVRWTWRYADGASEEVVLENGDEFADWIGRFDVPGSTFVEGLLAPESAGQVRRFSLAPGRAEPVTAIVLESFDNQVAPTIVALTAELAGAGQPAPEPRPAPASAGTAAGVLLLGGGSSHDFARHWGTTDVATLRAAGIAGVRYAEDPGALASELPALRVLILAGNRPIPPGAAREAVMSFVEQGGGLLLLHAATWRNWDDWPEFNAELAGGGARSHEDYAEFDVTLTGEHPILAGVPPSFAVADELYRFELDAAAGSAVLATGRSRSSGSEYPVLWVSARGAGRIAGFTLGHDQAAHASEAYRALIQNAARWLAER
jgi:putative heme-binding domain-containing protein